jgi:hypothetical protein
MRRAILGAAFAAASCAGLPGPFGSPARPDQAETRFTMYAGTFDVSCDRCRVEYGRHDTPLEDVAEGDWQGHAGLGTLRSGDKVRVVLRADPVGDTRILRARIVINGITVATSGAQDPGQAVSLTWIVLGTR